MTSSTKRNEFVKNKESQQDKAAAIIAEHTHSTENSTQQQSVSFNPDQNKIVVFGAKKSELDNLSFNFDSVPVVPVSQHKHLGVIFSSDGKWKSHIDGIIEKVSKQMQYYGK